MSKLPRVVPDSTYPGMYRVRWPDGSLSDMVNLTRGRDAVACFLETAERRRRRAPAEAHRSPVVRPSEQTDPQAPQCSTA
jgi:hypothetical protein